MDLVLALDLVHALAVVAWLSGAAVLGLILLAARRDAGAARRAVRESDLIGRRVLRPTSSLALATALLLAGPAGGWGEAWLVLSALLVAGSLLARPLLLRPAVRAAAAGEPGAALGLARLDLAAQAAAAVLMAAQPGWAGAAILAGLAACLALALALARSLGEGLVLPS